MPRFRRTTSLEHIGGLFSGGSVALEVGSYRFGRTPGSILFASGKPQEPRFGLTIDPDGIVTLFPPQSGVRLDGLEVVEPTPIAPGQVIGVGHDRFRLRPKERLSVSRRGSAGGDSLPTMPTPSRGRAIDQAIIDWALEIRDREQRSHWVGTAGPVQVYFEIERGEFFNTGQDDPGFGQALIGTTDRRYFLPDEVAAANEATRDELASLLTVMSSLPVLVDFGTESLAISGPRTLSGAIASWIVLSLAVHTAPADLAIVTKVDADAVEWSWVGRLPHAADHRSRPLVVTVINERHPVPIPTSGAIVLLEPFAAMPDEVGSIIRLSPESASLVQASDAAEEIEIAPIGLSSAVAVERSMMMADHLSDRHLA